MRHELTGVYLPLAWRSVRRHRRKSLATGGFILVATALVVVMHGVTVGINDTMVLNTTGLHYGQVFIEAPPGTDLETLAEQVRRANLTRMVLRRERVVALAANGQGTTSGLCYAVDPAAESSTTAIARRIVAGRYPAVGRGEILLGSAAAQRLRVRPGERIPLTLAGGFSGMFAVSGIFRTGVGHFDDGVFFIPATELPKSMERKLPGELALFLRPGVKPAAAAARLAGELAPSLSVRSWEEMLPDLVQLVRLNETSVRIMMALVFILVGFGIANTFILTIVERFRELGILKAMGMTPRELMLLIFLESFIVCLIATAVGLLVGCGLTGAAARHGIDINAFTSHNQYFVVTSLIRPRLTLGGVCWMVLLSLAVSLVSASLPTRIAARKVTAETLRFA